MPQLEYASENQSLPLSRLERLFDITDSVDAIKLWPKPAIRARIQTAQRGYRGCRKLLPQSLRRPMTLLKLSRSTGN